MSGEAKPRAVVTYVMAGVTVALLLATTTWATILIRCAPGPAYPKPFDSYVVVLLKPFSNPNPSRTFVGAWGKLLRACRVHQP